MAAKEKGTLLLIWRAITTCLSALEVPMLVTRYLVSPASTLITSCRPVLVIQTRVCCLDQEGLSILFEGTQGSGLSIFHGQYPHVTCRDTNVAGCLAEAGISASRVRRIIMVVRPMPIRVGNPDGDKGYISGNLKHEVDFETVA